MSENKPKRKVKRAPKEQYDVPPLEKAQKKEISDLISDALDTHSEEARKAMDLQKQKDVILGFMGEFMRNFTLVGFSHDYQPIIISKATTALDSEALTSLTRKVYASHIKNYGS